MRITTIMTQTAKEDVEWKEYEKKGSGYVLGKINRFDQNMSKGGQAISQKRLFNAKQDLNNYLKKGAATSSLSFLAIMSARKG